MNGQECGGETFRDDGLVNGRGTAMESIMAHPVKAIAGADRGTRVHSARYTRARLVLCAHGLTEGPGGYDPVDLTADASARGWILHAEPTRRIQGVQRWRATLLAHRCDLGNPLGVIVAGTNGHGSSESEAMAIALASMLARPIQT